MQPRYPLGAQLIALICLVLASLACGRSASEDEFEGEAPRIQEFANPEVPENIVDLTHAFGPDTIYWPTDTQGFEHEVLAAGHTEQGYYYAAGRFSSAEHGGTHLDAPVHFHQGGATAETIPIERLVGLGVVVDVSERVFEDRDYQIQVEDFLTWEKMHGAMPEGAIVLLHTGFGRHWPDRARYLGTDRVGPEAIPELHFPGLHPEAATWLKTEREIKAVGIDTPSIDYGQSKLFASHVALFEGDIPAFENVANLTALPNRNFLVFALPMKIAGGSGGPLRIIACW